MLLPIAINVLLVIHVLISLLIILLVLMQRPKNEGLGAAFGGGMTENLFGAQTTNVLQTITRWLGGIFFALTLLLSYLYVKHTGNRSSTPVQQRLTAPTKVPAAPPTPLPATTSDSNGTPGSAASPPVTLPSTAPSDAKRAEDAPAAPPASTEPQPPLEKPADAARDVPNTQKPATSPADSAPPAKPGAAEAPPLGEKPASPASAGPVQPAPTVPPALPSGSSQ